MRPDPFSNATLKSVVLLQVLVYFFYFPALGDYRHYPVHVSKSGKVGCLGAFHHFACTMKRAIVRFC